MDINIKDNTRIYYFKTKILVIFIITTIFFIIKSPRLECHVWHVDMACVLTSGQQLLNYGKYPFVDFFTQYGPLSTYSMAFALLVWNTPLSMNIFCSIFLGLTITLFNMIIYRRSTVLQRLIGTLICCYSVTSFYRWWECLFVLLTYYILSSNKLSQKNIFYAACISGITFLFRFDLGIFCFTFCLANILYNKIFIIKDFKIFRALTLLNVGFMLIIICWLDVLLFQGGSILDYFSCTFYFSGYKFASGEAVYQLKYIIIEILYLLLVVVSFVLGIKHKDRVFFNTGLVVIGLFPLCYFQKSVSHYTPMLPAYIMGCIFFTKYLFGNFKIISYIMMLVCYYCLLPDAGYMMTKIDKNPFNKLKKLNDYRALKIEYPDIFAIKRIEELKVSHEGLVFAIIFPQYYYFTDSENKDIFIEHLYFKNSEYWTQRFNENFKKLDPAIVAVNNKFLSHDLNLQRILSNSYTLDSKFGGVVIYKHR